MKVASSLSALLITGVFALGDVLDLKTDSFKTALEGQRLTMVKFYAPWCGHCKKLAPEFIEAAKLIEEKKMDAKLAEVNCDIEKDLCSEHKIQGYPTLKVFLNSTTVSDDYVGERSSAEIANYVEKRLRPAITELDAESAKKFTTSTDVVCVFAGSKDTHEYKAFTEVASKNSMKYTFGAVIDSKEVAESLSMKQNSVKLFKKFDEKENVYSGSLTDTKQLEKWIEFESTPIMADIGPQNYEKYMGSGLPLVFFFHGSDKDKAEIGPLVEAAAKEFKGKLSFIYIDASKFGQYATHLNLEQKWPNLGIHDTASNLKYPFPLDSLKLVTEDIKKFASDYVAGKLQPFFKSEPVPTDNDKPLKDVVYKNWDTYVNDLSKDVLLELYAPWCSHCKKLAPILEEVAKKYADHSDKVIIAKMDATANDLPSSAGFNITHYPTIKFFKASEGSRKPVDYNGGHTVKDFIDFISSQGTHKVKPSIDEAAAAAEDHKEEEDEEHEEL